VSLCVDAVAVPRQGGYWVGYDSKLLYNTRDVSTGIGNISVSLAWSQDFGQDITLTSLHCLYESQQNDGIALYRGFVSSQVACRSFHTGENDAERPLSLRSANNVTNRVSIDNSAKLR
jgi:hypothetical protein